MLAAPSGSRQSLVVGVGENLVAAVGSPIAAVSWFQLSDLAYSGVLGTPRPTPKFGCLW